MIFKAIDLVHLLRLKNFVPALALLLVALGLVLGLVGCGTSPAPAETIAAPSPTVAAPTSPAVPTRAPGPNLDPQGHLDGYFEDCAAVTDMLFHRDSLPDGVSMDDVAVRDAVGQGTPAREYEALDLHHRAAVLIWSDVAAGGDPGAFEAVMGEVTSLYQAYLDGDASFSPTVTSLETYEALEALYDRHPGWFRFSVEKGCV